MNAVFFDIDGTLADTREDLANTVNHTRRDFGLSDLPLGEVMKHVGRGAKVLLEESIPELADRGDELRERFLSHYAEHATETVQLYPGVRRTLDELRERGYLLGVNTSKPAFAARAIVEKFGLNRYFGNAIVAGGDCAEMKPSAMPLRECAARMGGHRLSSRDWMVGDSWTDMQCAENAGIKAAFCTFGFGQLNGSRCTQRLGRMDELLRYLPPED